MYCTAFIWNVYKGCVGVESGFILGRNPDTVRSPDVFYVRAERIPTTGIPEGFWEVPPDLAVEVVSPSESAADVRDKVRDYLSAGTQLVWIIYPRSREVMVHTPDGLAKTYSEGDELAGFEVLPNFTCVVASLFE
jgi:Uma2 family endonuclease